MNKSIVSMAIAANLMFSSLARAGSIPESAMPNIIIPTDKEPVTPGIFQPTWASLHQYQTPDWFRDAKFGIWFCYGPQCQAEMGDWYARSMYVEGSPDYKDHLV